MSYNGSGTFQINTSGQPVVAGTVISATAFNALTADLATGLSTAITKDGQTTTTARIPFAAGISSTLTTDSSSVSTGSIITAGGVGVAKNLYVGVNANVAGTLGVTGVSTFAAGTAAAPAITTTGDTNTGIFFPAADTIAFSEGGAESMRIDSSGNVGIGTTSPAGRLDVTTANTNDDGLYLTADGTSFGYASNITFRSKLTSGGSIGVAAKIRSELSSSNNAGLLFFTTASGTNAEKMRLDASGNLGLGTTSPTFAAGTGLQVKGSGFTNVRVTSGALTGTDLSQDSSGGYLYVRDNLPLMFGTNNAERARIDSSGNLLVGTTSSLNARIGIVSSSGTASINCGDGQDSTAFGIVQIVRAANQPDNKFHISFVRTGNKVAGMGFLDNSDTFAVQNTGDNSGNGVTLGNAATSWGTTSDERKKDIKGTIENALVKLANWRTVYFSYKNDEHNESRVGLIAQDIQATLPEAVSVETDEIGTLQLRYTEVIPVLVKAIQEQQAIITQLQADVAALKGTP